MKDSLKGSVHPPRNQGRNPIVSPQSSEKPQATNRREPWQSLAPGSLEADSKGHCNGYPKKAEGKVCLATGSKGEDCL